MMKIDRMKESNISQVLKVNDTVKNFPLHNFGITVLQVYLEDTPDYELNIETEINPCLNFIEDGMKKNVGTLVVCTAGMSRSATVCIAYLMKHRAMSYQHAFD